MALTVLALGVLAVGALFVSDLPNAMAWMSAPWVLATAAWMARREMARPRRQLLIPAEPSREERKRVTSGAGSVGGMKVAGSGGHARTGAGEGEDPADWLPLLDGMPLVALEGQWRGRVVVLRGRGQDGRRHRLLLWPDVTTPHGRRELRLALRDRATSPSRASVAP